MHCRIVSFSRCFNIVFVYDNDSHSSVQAHALRKSHGKNIQKAAQFYCSWSMSDLAQVSHYNQRQDDWYNIGPDLTVTPYLPMIIIWLFLFIFSFTSKDAESSRKMFWQATVKRNYHIMYPSTFKRFEFSLNYFFRAFIRSRKLFTDSPFI